MKKYILIVMVSFLFFGCKESGADGTFSTNNMRLQQVKKRRVLYINSYHQGYHWSDGISSGIKAELGKRNDIDLKIFRMDTKRNKSKKFKLKVAIKAKGLIEAWKPDIVIASDDNVAKYLIVPYYKNATLPFVFCGLNWDASVYGFPCSNVTGMIEVSLVKELLKLLGKFARGQRVAILAPDTTTSRKEVRFYRTVLGIKPNRIRLVKTISEWKKAFVFLQRSNDILLLETLVGFTNESSSILSNFVKKHIKIPIGTTASTIAKYSVVCFAKSPQEQGEWAAKTALRILSGTKPSAIPIVKNHRARIILNMSLARKLEIKFSIEMIDNAILLLEK